MQREPGGVTRRNLEELRAVASRGAGIADLARGAPVGRDGAIPMYLLELLWLHLHLKSPRTDLVRYGVVPGPSAVAIAGTEAGVRVGDTQN